LRAPVRDASAAAAQPGDQRRHRAGVVVRGLEVELGRRPNFRRRQTPRVSSGSNIAFFSSSSLTLWQNKLVLFQSSFFSE